MKEHSPWLDAVTSSVIADEEEEAQRAPAPMG
jgi:hypothetical protein